MQRLIALVLACTTAPAFAQEPTWPNPGDYVAVTLKDARSLQGIVTSETTDQSLALARTIRGLTTESEFPKSKIAAIEKQSPPELKLADPAAPAMETELPAPPITLPKRVRTPHVASLSVRARLANWDADPQPDGLLVEVSSLDANGSFTPVSGNVDLVLYGERRQLGGTTHDDREAFFILEKTTKLLRTTESNTDAYQIRLPFRNFDPNRDHSIGEFAILQARLSIPGQGVFKASDDWTQIQDSSRTRDNLQQLTGSRYLR